MPFDILLKGSVAIVSPIGALVGGDETRHLEAALDRLVLDGNRKILMDLSGVPQLNNAAAGVVFQAGQRVRNQGGVIYVCGLPMRETLVFIKEPPLKLFDRCEDAFDALTRLSIEPPELNPS